MGALFKAPRYAGGLFTIFFTAAKFACIAHDAANGRLLLDNRPFYYLLTMVSLKNSSPFSANFVTAY